MGRHASNRIARTRDVDDLAIRQMFTRFPGLEEVRNPKSLILATAKFCKGIHDDVNRTSICWLVDAHFKKCQKCERDLKIRIDQELCDYPIDIVATDAESMEKMLESFARQNRDEMYTGRGNVAAMIFDQEYKRSGNLRLRVGPLPEPGSKRHFRFET